MPEKSAFMLDIASGPVLGLEKPLRINSEITLELTEHTYLPKIQEGREDWVTSVVVPAFRAFNTLYPNRVKTFATIGTGAGLDALAAIEILNPEKIMVTDMHKDVVEAALRNIKRNLSDRYAVDVSGETGELVEPLITSGYTYDVVYENLPNIPLPDDRNLGEGINSSSFIPRDLKTGETADQHLVQLHAQILSQAKCFLTPGGQILSSIGARVPLRAILDMAREAGCEAEILIYTWKIQTEAEEVIYGCAEWEKKGKGPFYFYPVARVQNIFARYASPVEAAREAFRIEEELEPYRVQAQDALSFVAKGEKLAHTVVVIASRPE